ncbi:MAG: efflux RND transporter permease subunit [Marinifilaceae bacterium]|jgi:multidrug efflux pump subunit AcrB|nr:efflux RND transporter permease subunit [Marinifilaceae bacterium]
MRKLISYFIKYPITGNILIILTLAIGFIGFQGLNSTMTPQIDPGAIRITAAYPGASPQEIEEGIILKIEQNLKGISGIDRMVSTSRENVGVVTVKIKSGYNSDQLLQDVKNAVDQINSFPAGMEPPSVSKREHLVPAMFCAVTGDIDLRTLKKYARKIENDLRSTDGISKVFLSGFPNEEIEIAFRENDLKKYKMTLVEAVNAVRASNMDLTGGTIKGESEELFIRTKNKKYYASELANVVLRANKQGIVYLRDVADLSDKWSESVNKDILNDKRSISISVFHTTREDLIKISEAVTKYSKEFNEEHKDVDFKIIYDLSSEISVMQELLAENGLQGFLLVILFLSLFLNRRLSFWVAFGIPLSFMGMFIIASIYGITLNKISLFGMILVIGILVDDGIVICENIYQHYERGKRPVQAAIDGTIEVMPAVVSAVLTTVIAFATFFFIEGVFGQFFVEMGVVVIAALLFSLIECMFILPAHVAHSKALKVAKHERKNTLEQRVNNSILKFRDKYFSKFLDFLLRNKAITVAVMFSLLIITAGAYMGGIIKSGDSSLQSADYIDVNLQMPAGTPEAVTYKYLERIEEGVKQVRDKLNSERTDGNNVVQDIGIEQSSSNVGLVRVILLAGEIRGFHSNDFSMKVKAQVGEIPEAEKLNYVQNSHFGKPIAVSLLSYDLNELEMAKDELKSKLKELSGLTNIVDNDEKGMREVKITLKEKAYQLGLTLNTVISQVRQGFWGAEVQRINRGQDLVKVYVRYAKKDRSSIGNLEEMRIRDGKGNSYPLKEIANMKLERNLIVINHYNGKRQIRVEADLAGQNINLSELKEEVYQNILPTLVKKYKGLSFRLRGHEEEMKKASASINRVIPIILLLLIAVIGFTFRSIVQAVLIFLLLPFGFVGIGWGHFLHGYSLDMPSYFGIVALLGVMVNDAIILVAAMNDNLRKGMKFFDSVYQASLSRFRPIVLTSITTIAGLYPLILSNSPQAAMVVPMAISVAYGLLIATLITLVFLPVLLIGVNNIKRQIQYLKTGKLPEAEDVEQAVIEQKEI